LRASACGSLGGFDLAELAGFSLRVVLAAGAMMLVLWSLVGLLEPRLGDSVPGLVLLLAVELAAGLIVFAAAVTALRVPEARLLWAQLTARIRR
jgi:hypothetical protein